MNWLIKLCGGYTHNEYFKLIEGNSEDFTNYQNELSQFTLKIIKFNNKITKLDKEINRQCMRNYRARKYIKEAINMSNQDVKDWEHPFEAKIIDILNGKDRRTGKNKK